MTFSPEGVIALGEQLRASRRDTERLESQFVRLRDGLLTVEGLRFEEAGGSLERLVTAFGDSRLEIVPLSEDTSTLGEQLNTLGEIGNAAGAAIGRAFADAAIRARDLGDVLQALLATIVQAAATAFIGDPIARLFSGIAGRRFGGRVAAGQPVVVGEGGPEVFRPDAAGTVLPGPLGGSTVIQINGVNAPELVEAAVERALLARVPNSVGSTVNNPRFRRGL